MSHEPYGEMAAAYALGALEGEERSQFEAHLREGCRECETTLRDHAETLAALAADLPPVAPSPSVKAELLARIEAEPQPAAEPRPTRLIELPRRRWTPRRLAWASAMAAAVLLVVGYLGLRVNTLTRQLEEQARQMDAIRSQMVTQRELLALLRSPETHVVSLAGQKPSPAAAGRMWWHKDTGGLFVASGLPAAPPGKTYQLWAIAGGKPVSAGVFDVDSNGSGGLQVKPIPGVQHVDVFAVTLEPAGGLPQHSGEIYLASK